MTRLVFMGTPEFAVSSLEALIRANYDVVGVLTKEDRPAGRGQRVEESPVKQAAMAHGLTIQQPRTLRQVEAQVALAALAPELIVVAAYGLILPQTVLELPRFGCVNVHGSLLPRHRGAAPIAAAILAGDEEAGITIMLMDAGVDTGPLLSSASMPIAAEETTGSLTGKLAELGAGLLVSTLPGWLAGEIPARPQPAAGASFAARITREEGAIDWSEPAWMIERRVRAYQPWPTAYTTWSGQRLKVLRARAEVEDGGPAQRVGLVIVGPRGQVGVTTGQGILWLEELQLAGKRAMTARAFLGGARGFAGAQLT